MCWPFTSRRHTRVAVTDLCTKTIDRAYPRHYGEIIWFSGGPHAPRELAILAVSVASGVALYGGTVALQNASTPTCGDSPSASPIVTADATPDGSPVAGPIASPKASPAV